MPVSANLRRAGRSFLAAALIGATLGVSLVACGHDAADGPAGDVVAAGTLTDREVEAACGQCRFGLTGGECDLAVRFDGVARFVSGTAIDDHGDAHAADGFCNAVRTARVSGRVEGETFVVTAFELLPPSEGSTPDPAPADAD